MNIPNKKPKYTLRHYDGDDQGSWAVFRSKDVQGLGRSVIFWNQAKPIACGLTRPEAQRIKDKLELNWHPEMDY
jgi:hypothetical protein